MSAAPARELSALLVSGAWADEIAHELATPVSFLEGLVQRLTRGQHLDADDLSIAAEELDRVRNLVRSLRKVKEPARALTTRGLARMFEEAAAIADVAVEVDLPPAATASVDDSYVPLALAPLLRAMSRFAVGGRPIAITGHTEGGGATVHLTAHLDEASPRKLTSVGDVWTAAAAGEQSLEIVIAKRIARAHGQRLTEVAEERTRRLSIHVAPE